MANFQGPGRARNSLPTRPWAGLARRPRSPGSPAGRTRRPPLLGVPILADDRLLDLLPHVLFRRVVAQSSFDEVDNFALWDDQCGHDVTRRAVPGRHGPKSRARGPRSFAFAMRHGDARTRPLAAIPAFRPGGWLRPASPGGSPAGPRRPRRTRRCAHRGAWSAAGEPGDVVVERR